MELCFNMRKELIRKSKLLSLVLRHDPSAIGIKLDDNGWASVKDLLQKAARAGIAITRAEIDEIVLTNEKRRFDLDVNADRIRANQGHSIEVDVEIPEAVPPAELFHGSATRHAESILSQGLLKQQRQHVHLSQDISTARAVGARHGSPVIFKVMSEEMYRAGHRFYLSKNGVWLTDAVPANFLVKL